MATRALVTGGEGAEFEQILAEGLGIVRKQNQRKKPIAIERSLIGRVSVAECSSTGAEV